MPKKKAEVDYYAVQANYGGVAGWEDVTAEESYEGANEALSEYVENDADSTGFRIVKVYKSGRRVVMK